MTTPFAQYAGRLEELWAQRHTGLVVLRSIPSTQVAARSWIRNHQDDHVPLPDFDLLTWQQEQGIGRGAKHWTSPPGNGVYASLIRRLPRTLSQGGLQVLPLLVSVALCGALNSWLGGRCAIRWPNDLWVDGRKLAGLLIDVLPQGEDDHTVIIGFGVNYQADLEPLHEPRATSLLAEEATTVDLEDVAFGLVKAVDASLAHWPVGQSIIDEYRRASIHQVGETMHCRIGEETLEGRFLGFNPHGFLRLEVGDEERLVPAGELLVEA